MKENNGVCTKVREESDKDTKASVKERILTKRITH